MAEADVIPAAVITFVPASSSVKLAQFWRQAPAAWFAQAECIFDTKRVMDSIDKYCHLMASLSPESIHLIMVIVDCPPAMDP